MESTAIMQESVLEEGKSVQSAATLLSNVCGKASTVTDTCANSYRDTSDETGEEGVAEGRT